ITDALTLLRSLHRRDFLFQASLAASVASAAIDRDRILIQAPTGSGKTLVSQLGLALLARTKTDFRAIVVVPSRGLIDQHFAAGSWLRQAADIPLHVVDASTPRRVAHSILTGPGLVFTTPITLHNRMHSIAGFVDLSRYDLAVFDEIDTFVTVDDGAERR